MIRCCNTTKRAVQTSYNGSVFELPTTIRKSTLLHPTRLIWQPELGLLLERTWMWGWLITSSMSSWLSYFHAARSFQEARVLSANGNVGYGFNSSTAIDCHVHFVSGSHCYVGWFNNWVTVCVSVQNQQAGNSWCSCTWHVTFFIAF